MKARAECPINIKIARSTVEPRERQRDEAAFDNYLRDHALEVCREIGVATANFETLEIDPESIRKRAIDLSSLLHINPYPVFDLDLFPGYQLLSPPYDTSWSVGSGTPVSAWEGDPSIAFPRDGFSASGFGVYLSTQEHVAISVVPHGQFTAGWVNFTAAPPLRSAGGTGTVVYCDETLLVSHRPHVWSIQDPRLYTSAQFDMPFASTATPPAVGSLGTVPLAPVLFDMLPGKRYLVWFYIWQISENVGNKGFIVFSRANVPLIVVRISPPLFLH